MRGESHAIGFELMFSSVSLCSAKSGLGTALSLFLERSSESSVEESRAIASAGN
jgi:hypothetical protein